MKGSRVVMRSQSRKLVLEMFLVLILLKQSFLQKLLRLGGSLTTLLVPKLIVPLLPLHLLIISIFVLALISVSTSRVDAKIERIALKHDTHNELYRKPFGAVSTGEEARLRIRAKVGELESAMISYWDSARKIRIKKEMERIGQSPGGEYEYWEVFVGSDIPTVLWYHFILRGAGDPIYYGDSGQDGGLGRASAKVPDDFQLTIFDQHFKTPHWMKNAITYQIFPDRFYDGNPTNNRAAEERGFRGNEPLEYWRWNELPDNPREAGVNPNYRGDGIWNNDFFGGDLRGIIQKLDYLQSLGVKAIYFNPIFEAVSNHKYDTADYENIDRMFGTNADFLELAYEVKKRGMHLILDGVFNHLGDDSRYFDRYGKWSDLGVYEAWLEGRKKESPFSDWFVIKPDGSYECWWGFDSLPVIQALGGSELNVDSYADYIIRDEDSIARRWVKDGSSGWRLDVSGDVTQDFWAAFRKYLKGEKELPSFPNGEPIMIAENWHDASEDLLGDTFDSTMNYCFRNAVIDFILNGNAEAFDAALTEIYEDYPKEAFYVMMNLLGSHDTARIKKMFGDIEPGLFADLDRAVGKTSAEIKEINQLAAARLKLAAIFQMSYPGSPTIYYGDEVGLTGHKDPDCRRPFPWEQVTPDNTILSHYKKLAEIRNNNQVLKTGELVTLYAQGGTYAIGRKLLGERDAIGRTEYILNYYTGEKLRIADHNALAIVILSKTGEEELCLDLSEFARDGVVFVDRLNENREYTVRDGTIILSISPMWGAILVTKDNQDIVPPHPPVALAVAEEDRRVSLSWKPVTDAVFYDVFRTPIPGGHYTKVAEGLTEPQFTDTEVENLQRYFYTVTAIDEAGNQSTMSDYIVAVPSMPIEKAEVRHFSLVDDPGATGKHLIGVGNEVKELYADVYVPSVTEESGRGEGIIAQFGFGQNPDPATWIWIPAYYIGDIGNTDEYTGSFIPDRLGEWFISIRFSTNLGMSWKVATHPDGAYPRFTVISTTDLTSPQVPNLAEPDILHRMNAPSFVVLNFSLLFTEDVHHLELLRQGKGQDWQRIAILGTDDTSYLDEEVMDGTEYRYQIIAVDSSFNRGASKVVSVIPGPLILTKKAPSVAALSEVSPTIDGVVTEMKEWDKAIQFKGEGLLEKFFIGYGTHHLYLRADTITLPSEWIGKEYRLILYIGFYTGLEDGIPINALTRFGKEEIGFPLTQLVQLRFENVDTQGRGNVFRFVANGMEDWGFTSQIRLLRERIARVGDITEIQIPYKSLGIEPTEELIVWTRLTLEEEGKMLGTAPTQPLMAKIPARVSGQQITSFSDPVGDDHGPGTFVYATNPVFDAEGLFDLTEYTIFDQEGSWLLIFEFAALPNPWKAPFGFSHPILNIYMDVKPGGETSTHKDGDAMQVQFSKEYPWDVFIKVTGWPDYGRLLATTEGEEYQINVSSDPSKRLVIVSIPKELLPTISGAHYVIVADQDGYSPDHIRPVGRTAGEWTGGGNTAPMVAPLVFDYLAPSGYTQEEILTSYNIKTKEFATLVPIVVKSKERG